jgi:hypothetical protein
VPTGRSSRPEDDRGAGADCGLRLTLFGVAAIVVGAGFLLLGLLQLALALVEPAIETPSAWAGVALHALIALVLVASGIGSIFRRRWVRPVMLLVSGTWILVGVMATWFAVRLGPDLALAAGVGPGEPAAVVLRAVTVAVAGGLGVLLPAAFFWAYRDPRVQIACDRSDRRGSDRCPAEVLTLSAALAAGALLSLPMLARPVVPVFGHLVTGWAGRLALGAGIVACGVLAWSTYRLRVEGFWATLALLILLGLTTVWTFARVDPLDVYRLLGYPDDWLERLPSIGSATRTATQLGAVGLTVGGVAWVLRLRRHFT